MSVFSIGISGIQLAQTGMQVTQHNITNSSTDGYTRQSVIQTASAATGFATGFMGNGVKVTTVQRQYNDFMTGQVRAAETQLAALDSYDSQIAVIDNLVADSSAGISPALQDFFSSVQQVATYPASLPARQSMVSSAEALTSRFQSASQRISDLYAQVNVGIEDNVQLINSYAKQVADLNQRIITAESAVNQPANDLRDQRDRIIGDLNKIIKVQTIPLAQNGIEVLIGKGQLLVMGNQSFTMSAMRSSTDPAKTAVALDLGSGQQELPEGILTGGTLGGLLAFRSETLDKAVNSLGKVASSLALTFNAQHTQGMDLFGSSQGDATGSVGLTGASYAGFVGDFFTIPDPKIIPSDPAAPPISVTFTPPKLTTNLANGNYYTDITNSDYRLDYAGGQFNLTRVNDGVTWNAASVSALNTMINDATDSRGAQGITLTDAGGTYTDGQSWLIEPTRNIAGNIAVDGRIAGDVRLVAAGQPLASAAGLTNGGTLRVAVNRVRTDSTANVAGPGYPVTFAVGGTGDLSIPSGGSARLTVYDLDGNSSTYDLSGASASLVGSSGATTVPLSVGGGRSFELWDQTSRVLLTSTGTQSAAGGDTFTISSNYDATNHKMIGVSDSSNMVMLGKLLSQNTSDGARNSFQAAYAQMVADVGNKAREISVNKDAQKALADQATATQSSLSGVNLDEEAANLLRYQQLYQAAARSISVGQKMFDELLAIARG